MGKCSQFHLWNIQRIPQLLSEFLIESHIEFFIFYFGCYCFQISEDKQAKQIADLAKTALTAEHRREMADIQALR